MGELVSSQKYSYTRARARIENPLQAWMDVIENGEQVISLLLFIKAQGGPKTVNCWILINECRNYLACTDFVTELFFRKRFKRFVRLWNHVEGRDRQRLWHSWQSNQVPGGWRFDSQIYWSLLKTHWSVLTIEVQKLSGSNGLSASQVSGAKSPPTQSLLENGCEEPVDKDKEKSVHGSSWFLCQIVNRALFVWFDKFVQWKSQSFTPFNFNWKLDEDFRSETTNI